MTKPTFPCSAFAQARHVPDAHDLAVLRCAPRFFVTRTAVASALCAWAMMLCMGFSGAAEAQTRLAAQQDRISDATIAADYDSYKAMQSRINQLNERGIPVRDYALSKAQCWLDVSLHEYTRNDRSDFPQAAFSESEKLIEALERKHTPDTATALVNGAVRLRPDLWERTASLKQHSGFRCAWRQVACAEVELVHAGNEHSQQQWRHSKPYVQIAEDLLSEASAAVQSCSPPPAAVP